MKGIEETHALRMEDIKAMSDQMGPPSIFHEMNSRKTFNYSAEVN